MRPSLALLLALTLTPCLARAADPCPTVRLDQTDEDVRSIPVWDQGSAPACYSYSASFLASVWARKNLKSAPASLGNFTDDPAATFEAMMQAPEKDAILDAENGRTCMALRWISAGIANRAGNPANVPHCSMYGLVKKPGFQQLRPSSDILQHMHEAIEAPAALPYAVEFCSGVLGDENGSYIKKRSFRGTLTYLNSDDQYENFDQSCGFHVAVIVGQELRGGRCQFRVRNSWGPDAGDNGYFWVDAGALARNVLRVVEMK